MPADVLVTFHSAEGQTARIAERVATVLRRLGNTVDVRDVDAAPAPDGYDMIVVGDPIYMERHSRAIARYLREHIATINAMPSAFFQVSMTSAKADAEHTEIAHELVRKLLDRTGFDPDIVGMFAGALVYTHYGWVKRHIMRAIAKREGDDTDASRDYEYTDWDAVESFATDAAALANSGQIGRSSNQAASP
jgi:menaquinone-dependent protoporphyrinogen oxidase